MSPIARALVDEISRDPAALERLAELLAPHLSSNVGEVEDGWMSTKDAAAYLGLTPNALHRLTAARSVPFAQEMPGGKCWFLRSELDEWRRGQR